MKRVRKLEASVVAAWVVALAAANMPCAAAPVSQGSFMTVKQENSGDATALSQQYAKRVLAMKNLDLPDEWYPAKGTSPTERLVSAYQAMSPSSNKPASVEALLARYDNQGQPFCHSVWLNKPMRCSQCKDGGADGRYTVVSLRNDVSVILTAEEMHLVLEHGARFPDVKLALLEKVFAPPAARR